MKKSKRFLSVLLSLLMVLSCFVFAPEMMIKSEAAENMNSADGLLHLNSSGTFKILQLADLHSFPGFEENKMLAIRAAIKDTTPDLIVLTGDNVTGDNTRGGVAGGTGSESVDSMYYAAMKELTDEFHDQDGNKIPFVITFGNHDHEAASGTSNYNSDQKMYDLALELGALDFDNPTIGDVATGTIPIYGKIGTSKADEIVNKVIIVNSGNFINNGGTVNRSIYGRAGANEDGTDNETRYLQVCEYVSNEIDADPDVPVIAFQHIPLQEFYFSGIISAGGSIKSMETANSAISGNYQKGSKAQGGDYKETCCCSYYSTEALYNAYAKDNMIGVFYGHDHSNTVYGKGTVNGKDLVQGYGGGLQGPGTISTYTINPDDTTFVKTLTKASSASYTFPDASAYPSGTYISEIGVFFGSTYQNAWTAAQNAGFEYADMEYFANSSAVFRTNRGDKGSSNNPIIAYKTTTDISQAIRDIKATEQINYAATQTYNGCTYTAAANNSNSHGDCNEGTDGSGTNGKPSSHPVYLYYTKDRKAGDPITGLFGLEKLATLTGVDKTKPFKLVTNMRENNNSGSSVVDWANGTNKYRYVANLDAYATGATRLFFGFYHATPISTEAPLLTADGPALVVPDTIYLEPSTGAMTNFKYYLNNNTDGTAKSGYDTTGKVYFSYPGATNIKASLSGTNVSNISLTNGSEGSFTGALTTGISTKGEYKSDVLTWSFTYDVDGKTNTVYAYTVVYAPLVNAVASGYTTRKGSGTTGNKYPSMGNIVWATGLNDYKKNTGADAYGGMTYQPLLSTQIDQKTMVNNPANSVDDYLTYNSSGYGYAGFYRQNQSGENNVGKNEGILAVDTSRFSSYDLPYLSFGCDEVMINATALTGELEHSTQGSTFTCAYPGASTDTVYNVSYSTQTILPGGTRDGSAKWKTVYYFNDDVTPATGTIAIKSARSFTDSNNSSLSYTNTLNINVTASNKAALRQAVYTAYKYQLNKDRFTEASWNAFMANIKDNATALGNPASSTATANIDTYILAGNHGAVADVDYTVGYNLNGGTLSGTNPTGNNSLKGGFALLNPTKNYYDFLGWSEANGKYVEPDTDGYDKFVAVPKGNTSNLSYTANWRPTEYAISYALDNGSVTGNPATYNIETNTFTLSNPTKTGYTFAGWALSGATLASGSSASGTAAKVAKGSHGDMTATASWNINKSTLKLDPNGTTLNGSTSQITYSNRDYNSTQSIDSVTVGVGAEQIFTGWKASGTLNGALDGTTYTFGPTAGVTDTLTPNVLDAKFNENNKATVGFAAKGVAPSAISGITARSIINNTGFYPDMTLTDKVVKQIEVKNTYSGGTKDITSDVSVFPETNILYEENEVTFTDNDAEWIAVNGTKNTASGIGSTIYGYSDDYANNSTYSDGTAKMVTVDESMTEWPTFKFTFTGTGFDINSRCDIDTGLIIIDVFKSGTTTKATLADGSKAAKVMNTVFKDSKTIYQTPVIHMEMAEYGTYDVVAKVPYSFAFDPFYVKTAGGAADEDEIEFIKKNGVVYADLSSLLGEDAGLYQYEELCPITDEKKSAVDLIDMSGSLAGGSTSNSYSVYIDSVRIYNPAGTELKSGDVYNQYTADAELNPTYIQMRSKLLKSEAALTGDGVVYIESSAEDVSQTTANIADYTKQGSANEIYLTSGNGIGFQIDKSDVEALHLALRSPTGEQAVVVVGSKTFTINSATEMYYDVTDQIASDGTLAVTVSSGMAAIGECKLLGTASPVLHSSPAAAEAAEELVCEVCENPLETADELTFEVNFGELGTAYVTVGSDKFEYYINDGKWAVTVNLTEEEIAELFAESELSDAYTLGKLADTALVAEFVDGEWVPVDVTFEIESLDGDSGTTLADSMLTVFSWLCELMKLLRELFSETFSKIVIAA